jgi:hypothetical protein
LNLSVAKAGSRAELVQDCAQTLVDAFADYNAEFRAITQRARRRFEERDWHGSQRDAVERIELYGKYVTNTVATMQKRLGDEVQERSLWSSIRRRFTEIIDPLPDNDFPKTFFSSVTRKTFDTAGVDAAVEFVALDLDPLGSITTHVETKEYFNRGSVDLLVEELLADFRFRAPYRDFERSVKTVTVRTEHLVEEIRPCDSGALVTLRHADGAGQLGLHKLHQAPVGHQLVHLARTSALGIGQQQLLGLGLAQESDHQTAQSGQLRPALPKHRAGVGLGRAAAAAICGQGIERRDRRYGTIAAALTTMALALTMRLAAVRCLDALATGIARTPRLRLVAPVVGHGGLLADSGRHDGGVQTTQRGVVPAVRGRYLLARNQRNLSWTCPSQASRKT